ncbi:hypothetical protein GCM10009841_24450 [Microlunatus panaciterrae]|uniref:Membrane protein implicated in regulation of membrane protease activity n=1 Tax=Microlunatus panaciterrae TaxID=400768 RepID=A0ABS2RGK8_9ACTN|nr:hypothetical protein [Microlunatus panaciterrae]MBM7797326.1 membrane protein implicated in regulation of membrane protease activity [Microlunatus panaciterrae]
MIKKPLLAGLGGLAVLIGLLWIGQGAGLIGGSFMTGSNTWLVIGIVALVVGLLVVLLSTRGRSWRDPNGPPGQH